MSDNTKLKISNGLNEDKYSVKSKFVNFFLLAMFTLFPLFYTDYYYNIRHDKYYFFSCCHCSTCFDDWRCCNH